MKSHSTGVGTLHYPFPSVNPENARRSSNTRTRHPTHPSIHELRRLSIAPRTRLRALRVRLRRIQWGTGPERSDSVSTFPRRQKLDYVSEQNPAVVVVHTSVFPVGVEKPRNFVAKLQNWIRRMPPVRPTPMAGKMRFITISLRSAPTGHFPNASIHTNHLFKPTTNGACPPTKLACAYACVRTSAYAGARPQLS